MSKHMDEVSELVSRAALQARLELVAADLESALERLSAAIVEIKAREGGDDDGSGADQ